MRNRVAFICLILPFAFSCQQSPSSTEVAEILEPLLQSTEVDSVLANVYEENEFKPIWVKSRGLNTSGEDFYEALDGIVLDGLNKEDYLSKEQADLLEAVKESKDPKIHAQLDIAISNSFLKLASDLHVGRIDPSKLKIEWKMDRKAPTVSYEEILLSIAEGGSLNKGMEQLRPSNKLYTELRDLLSKQASEEQGQAGPIVAFDGKIEKGDRHESIPSIRKKLFVLKDLSDIQEGEEQLYDDQLFEAVKRFQKRHGLIDDGVIGGDFAAAINYSHQDLISKILINMERLRWLPDFSETDNNKVIVNIPDFHLYYMQEKDTVLTSRVVVGKEYRQTPVFKAEMTYLVFSPTWTLPETILWEDAIPAIQKDRGYLAKNNMKVLDMQENEVNSRQINWGKLQSKEDFPYLIRQSPGKLNPLGQVKFMFPNDHYIYIHDSPAQGLFSQDERTFSSGCIRMENPAEFAQILLEEAEEWDEEKISQAMNQDEEKTVKLNEAQDVWILYLTVWQNGDIVEVREDVYDMDRKLAEALAIPYSGNFL